MNQKTSKKSKISSNTNLWIQKSIFYVLLIKLSIFTQNNEEKTIANFLKEKLIQNFTGNIVADIFEKYGDTQSLPFKIKKELIEQILSIFSIESFFPEKFEFQNEIVTYSDVCNVLEEKYGTLIKCKIIHFIKLQKKGVKY